MRAPDFLEKNERNCCRAVPSGRRRWGVASVAVMVGELMSPVSQSAAQECQSGKKDPSDDGKVGQRSGDASRPPSLSLLALAPSARRRPFALSNHRQDRLMCQDKIIVEPRMWESVGLSPPSCPAEHSAVLPFCWCG
jgi:hypothetical protein